MRTRLLCTVPSADPEPDTGRAVNDESYRFVDAVQPCAIPIKGGAAAPIAEVADHDEDHYWLDGYAGI